MAESDCVIWFLGQCLEDFRYQRQSDRVILAHVYPKVAGAEQLHGYICECRKGNGQWLDRPICKGLALIPTIQCAEGFLCNEGYV